MISVTKLLFMDEYYGDARRYSHNAHRMKSGAAEGMGPVVVWNSTRTCNLRCRHCYMESDGQKYDGELTTEEAKRFIDGLAEFRVPVLLFSGGEGAPPHPHAEKPSSSRMTPQIKQVFTDIIREGQEAGEIRSDVPVDLIAEMFHSLYQAAAFSHLDLTFQENIALKTRLLLDGIRRRDGQPEG